MKSNFEFRAARVVAALTVGVSVGLVQADTGYSNTGGAGQTAPAGLNGSVVVPHVLLLRVGSAGFASAVQTISFTPSITIPGGSSAWTGAPLSSTSPTQSVQAFAYTNHPAGAKLTCATTGVGPTDPLAYLYNTDITVATTAGARTDTLGHPGLNLACGASMTSIFRNAVYDANWTYTLSGASVVNYLPGGTHTFTIGYTLTNL